MTFNELGFSLFSLSFLLSDELFRFEDLGLSELLLSLDFLPPELSLEDLVVEFGRLGFSLLLYILANLESQALVLLELLQCLLKLPLRGRIGPVVALHFLQGLGLEFVELGEQLLEAGLGGSVLFSGSLGVFGLVEESFSLIPQILRP